MSEFKSRYELLLEKLRESNQIDVLNEQDNYLIIKELSEGMAEFSNEQRAKEKNSELELAGVVLS